MVDILNLALPYFGLIFIGFACGRVKGLPEQGLAWMNFFLLYVSPPALLFGIMSKTPFAELNNPPFLIATTLGTASAFVLALAAGRLAGRLSFREATLAGLSGSFGNIGYMGPGLALTVLGTRAAAPTALFVLGVTVALRPLGRVPWEVPAVIAVKLLIHPLAVFGLMLLLGPFPQPWAATAILMASLPPALNVFVIARQHDTWIEPASVAVLIGTFASVITLTSVMWLMQTGRLVFP
jgi:predicted permease